MNKSIFITVRTGSTRLKNKSLLKINNISTIEYVINRVKKSFRADNIILCTTTLKEDDILCDIAQKNNINYFRGSVLDKLDRWLGAVNKYDVDFFVTADGDDLLCSIELIDLAFEQYNNDNFDFIEAPEDLIVGSFTYGIKSSALKKVCSIKNTDDTEMMWIYFKDLGLFKIDVLRNVPSYYFRPEIRSTLDYQEDFLFFEKVIENINLHNLDINSWKDILFVLDKNFDLIEINKFRNEDWKKNQIKKTKLILKEDMK